MIMVIQKSITNVKTMYLDLLVIKDNMHKQFIPNNNNRSREPLIK